MTMTTGAATRQRTQQQPRTPRASSASRQIREQRRGYARVVLRALARTYQGRPTAQVQRVLKDSLKPLGVHLSAATLHNLAVNIAAGQPVELP